MADDFPGNKKLRNYKAAVKDTLQQTEFKKA